MKIRTGIIALGCAATVVTGGLALRQEFKNDPIKDIEENRQWAEQEAKRYFPNLSPKDWNRLEKDMDSISDAAKEAAHSKDKTDKYNNLSAKELKRKALKVLSPKQYNYWAGTIYNDGKKAGADSMRLVISNLKEIIKNNDTLVQQVYRLGVSAGHTLDSLNKVSKLHKY